MKKGDPKPFEMNAELYQQLRQLARRYFLNEKKHHTLVPTALVHEAFMRFANEKSAQESSDLPPVVVLARLMRQVLINHARTKGRDKRGAGRLQVTLDENLKLVSAENNDFDLVYLDEALSRLKRKEPDLATLVEVRFFLGLTIEEAARELKLSPATVKRKWVQAKTWLFDEIEKKRNAA